jgi:hypothetical protein
MSTTITHFVPTSIEFGEIAPGEKKVGGIQIDPVLSDALVTAQIVSGGAVFRLDKISAFDRVLVDPDPNEFPVPKGTPGHPPKKPPQILVFEAAGTSDGVLPLLIKKGQLVSIGVLAFGTSSTNSPDLMEGTLVVTASPEDTVSVRLSMTRSLTLITFDAPSLSLSPGREGPVPIVIRRVMGPAKDARLFLSPNHAPGITMPDRVIRLEVGETKNDTLQFSASAGAALGDSNLPIQVAGETGLVFLPLHVIPPKPPAPGAVGVSGRFCEVADPPGSATVAPNAYGLKDGHARKSQLTYSVSGVLANVPNLTALIAQAFGIWQSAAPLTFNLLPSGGDIAIGIGVLNAPLLGSTAADGSAITFSSSASWSPQNPVMPGTTSLLAVAIHEIGHALGLLHATTTNSIMFPFNANIETLSNDDRSGIRALYGWAPKTKIPGIGSEAGPALCACGGTLIMAWRGAGDDHRIWVARSSDGAIWTASQTIPGAGTSDSPTLAWDGRTLWLACKGDPGDSSLYFASTTDLVNWTQAALISGVGSSTGPSMAIIPGAGPFLIWKGAQDDSGIYFSTFNGVWQPQIKVAGAGTSNRPVIVFDVAGVPRMVCKGVDGDSAIYTSTLRGLFWQPPERIAWVVAGNGGLGSADIGYPGTASGPGTTVAGAKILLAWRGAGEDQNVWFTQAALGPVFGGQTMLEWSSQAQLPNFATADKPTLASFRGNVYVACRGIDDDRGIYTTFV